MQINFRRKSFSELYVDRLYIAQIWGFFVEMILICPRQWTFFIKSRKVNFVFFIILPWRCACNILLRLYIIKRTVKPAEMYKKKKSSRHTNNRRAEKEEQNWKWPIYKALGMTIAPYNKGTSRIRQILLNVAAAQIYPRAFTRVSVRRTASNWLDGNRQLESMEGAYGGTPNFL